MPKSLDPKNETATEEYVWQVVNWAHKDLGDKFQSFEDKMEVRFNQVMEHLVDLAGKFKKFDEEQETIAYRQANNTDRLEKLEEKVFGSVQI